MNLDRILVLQSFLVKLQPLLVFLDVILLLSGHLFKRVGKIIVFLSMNFVLFLQVKFSILDLLVHLVQVYVKLGPILSKLKEILDLFLLRQG